MEKYTRQQRQHNATALNTTTFVFMKYSLNIYNNGCEYNY